MFRRKYHFFYIAFADKYGKTVGISIRSNRPYVNERTIQQGRQQMELDSNAPIIAVSYLGQMTIKQWNSPA